MMHMRHLFVVLLSVMWLSSVGAQDFPQAITEKGKSATAFLVTHQASATAFCINPSGYFVTNHHAIKGVAPWEMVQLVLNSGQPTERVIHARVVRSNPDNDLAVLRAYEPGNFAFLELDKEAALAETQRLEGFGFPFGDELSVTKEKFPSISVNGGSITSLRKLDGKLQEIQVDIALNHGNSGGPVLNISGRVVGIVRAGITGSGVNFVIPVQKLTEMLALPDVIFEQPVLNQSTLGEKIPLKARIGWILQETQKPVQMRLEIGPKGKPAHLVEMIAASDCFEARTAPVPAADGQKLQVTIGFESGSLEGLMEDFSFSIGKETVFLKDVESLTLGSSPKAILRRPAREISGAISDFSPRKIEMGGQQMPVDLNKAKSLKVTAPPLIDTITANFVVNADGKELTRQSFEIHVSGPAGKSIPNAPATPSWPSPGPSSNAIASGTGSKSPSLVDGGEVCNLPGTISDVAVGGAGRYLVLHMAQIRKLAIFDLTEGRITASFLLPEDNVYFAAGMSKLILVLCDSHVIQRWDLKTAQREAIAPLPFTWKVKVAAMGAASEGPLLLNWSFGSEEHDRANWEFIDIQTLAPIKYRFDTTPHIGTSFSDSVNLRASDDGLTFGIWHVGGAPTGLQLFTLKGQSVHVAYEHRSVGAVIPSSDGGQIFTSDGIFTPALSSASASASERDAGTAIPSHGGGLIIRAKNAEGQKSAGSTLSVYVQEIGNRPIATFDVPDLKSPRAFYDSITGLTLDKRIHLVPASGALLTIPGSADRLVFRRFNLMDSLNALGTEYFLVSSKPPGTIKFGAPFDYQIVAISKNGGLTYHLDSGPEGMAVSPTGLVSWKGLQDLRAMSFPVSITIRDCAGQQRVHSFTLKIIP